MCMYFSKYAGCTNLSGVQRETKTTELSPIANKIGRPVVSETHIININQVYSIYGIDHIAYYVVTDKQTNLYMSLASIMWRAISATVYISKECIASSIFHDRLTFTIQQCCFSLMFWLVASLVIRLQIQFSFGFNF